MKGAFSPSSTLRKKNGGGHVKQVRVWTLVSEIFRVCSFILPE